MFKTPFSFNGRIRRTEYGISFIIYLVVISIIGALADSAGILAVLYIPLLWFLWAQGAKRCHDVGHNGWWQIIPLYFFWLLFEDGMKEKNEYGVNPKKIEHSHETTTGTKKYCHQCGEKLDIDSKFCIHCGASTNQSFVATNTVQ